MVLIWLLTVWKIQCNDFYRVTMGNVLANVNKDYLQTLPVVKSL